MLVTPYPGANRDDVLRTLRDLKSAAQNAGNVHGAAQSHLTAYLEWATDSVRMLEHRVSTADIDRLILTRGCDRLLAAAGTLTGADIGTQRVLNGLVSHEIQQPGPGPRRRHPGPGRAGPPLAPGHRLHGRRHPSISSTTTSSVTSTSRPCCREHGWTSQSWSSCPSSSSTSWTGSSCGAATRCASGEPPTRSRSSRTSSPSRARGNPAAASRRRDTRGSVHEHPLRPASP